MNKLPKGFSLIEAIVALVVLSILFSTVWGWFGTAVTSTERIQKAVALPDVAGEFIRRLELIDLRQQQSGEMQIGQYQLSWRAQVEQRSDQGVFRRQPAWIVALFTVVIEISENGDFITEYTTSSVRQWRDPNYIDFGSLSR